MDSAVESPQPLVSLEAGVGAADTAACAAGKEFCRI